MSAHLRIRHAAIGVLFGALVLTACGGGGGSDGASSDGSGDAAATTTLPTDLGSILSFESGPHEFEEVDGSQARFINLLVHDGEGVDMDVYWGSDAETGKKAATVAYGEVSDWETFQVDKDAFLTPADGGTDIVVSFYPEGETDISKQIMQKSEPIDGDMMLTYTMGTGDGIGLSEDQMAASLGVGYEHTAGAPPAGKGWVALNESGVGGIEGGDFMTLSTATGCNDLVGTDIEGGTANSGQAFLVDVGTQSFTASDANTECAERTEPIDIDFEEGDQYVVYVYGTSLDDRQLLAVKLGE